jgi:ferrochelatase
MSQNYDAILVVSFGGPEGMADVMPFLENVTRGRNIPRARLEEVAHHYERFGGVSPINEQNRQLIAALREELNAHGINLPIYWGNRNWHPLLTDEVQRMANDGIRRALAFVTSAYSSYSSCRQYRENIQTAQEAVGARAPEIDKLRVFYNHPNFIAPNVENIRAALAQIPAARRATTHIAFTAHSIPSAMAANCDYEAQLTETSRLIAETLGMDDWRLVFQSRSGSPMQPWLEPDICDHLRELKTKNVADLVIAPVGFISDHVEILYDLDTEAAQLAAELGINMVRAKTVGAHPTFVQMIRELIEERLDPTRPRRALGARGASHDFCPIDCCLPGATARPAQTNAAKR